MQIVFVEDDIYTIFMCGIFGFLGTTNCFNYGIFALKQLRNRGYDSAGCCAIRKDNGDVDMILRKYASSETTDSLDMLEKDADLFNKCYSGIFHTRWATHGAKIDVNAHPHLDNSGKIALVHNGIIENYFELKQELEREHGIVFNSDTDTEVIVNLIGVYYYQSEDSNGVKHLEQSIMKAIDRLLGTWALVIVCQDKPDNIYCARHGSPLLIGFSDSYVMITSEQAGFGQHVDNYICLNNGDVTVLRRDDNKISFENKENYVLRDITVKINEISPAPYPYWTIKEINEQYEASIRALSFGGRIATKDKVKLGGLTGYEDKLKEVEHLILLGCGTSLNAGQHASFFFKDLCNFTTVQALDGSEFTVSDIPKKGKTCALFLSQSGETKDLYRCVKICHDNNVFTVGVINVVDSLIAREVDCGCYLNAGREVGVASTKAFTSQVIVLGMIAVYFAQIHDINKDRREIYIRELKKLPTDIRNTIRQVEKDCIDIAHYLITQNDMFILGKGSLVSVASEGALKTKEIGYIHSEAYGGNALRHGPYALLKQGTPIIFVNPVDENYSLMNSTIEEVKTREAYPIVITDSDNVSRHACHRLIVPSNEVFKGVIHNIPMQLIAYHMAVLKGHNPDMPKNLSKCVSV